MFRHMAESLAARPLRVRRSRAAAKPGRRLDPRHLGQTRPQALAQLVGLELDVRAALARDDDTGRGDARHAGETQELPGRPHRRVGYGP